MPSLSPCAAVCSPQLGRPEPAGIRQKRGKHAQRMLPIPTAPGENFPPLEGSRPATVDRGGKKGDLGAVGGDGGLLRLRWPAGHREVAETASLSPAGGGSSICPRISRVRVPGVSGEATAAAALRGNKSSRALSRPFGVSLRRHRRARGGGAPAVELLFRRSSPAARRPVREVSLLAFCSVGRVAARGLVQAWRVERTRSSRGGFGHRRRVWLQGRWGLGRVPDRWIFGVVLISSTASVCCGSSQARRRWSSFRPGDGGFGVGRPAAAAAVGSFRFLRMEVLGTRL